MMKSQLIFAIALLLSLSTTAQNEQPVVLVSSQGKVCYQSPAGGKLQQVQSGALLRNTGTLKMGGKASATLYCNGKFQTLTKGKHAMAPIFGDASSMRRLNFDKKFGDYLTNSALLAASAKGHNPGWANIIDPKKSGDGWGVTDPKKGSDGWGVTDPKKGSDGWGVTDPKKGSDGWGVTDPKKGSDGWGVTDPKKASDGWGGQGSKITGILPFGKVTPSVVVFSWSRPAGATSYELEISSPDGNVLHKATARDTFLKVDLKPLSLQPEVLYSWKISVPGQANMVSPTLQFLVDSEANKTAVLERLSRSDVYPSADPVTQRLMEALILEDNDWFPAAADIYAGLKQQHPKNNLVRMLYSAFLMRYGYFLLADNVVLP